MMDRRPRTRRQARQDRPKKPLTEAELERRALAYAERFASTKTRFLAVLRRTIRRRGPSDNDVALEAFALRLVERYSSSGLVDDLRFAEARAARLHRQGHPARAIAEKLRVAGVERADITSAIGESGASGAEGERAAALSYAKRRRLGPFRVGDPKPFRQKDLMALARRGFSRRVAESVLNASGPDIGGMNPPAGAIASLNASAEDD